MSEPDQFGLKGLLSRLKEDMHSDFSLAYGHDLTSLGLNLNSPDPLHPLFATPFGNAQSKAAIPDFTLPAAYAVQNVPPLHTKIPSFSDETLFAIFYQNPRDIAQEVAAGEL